MYVSVYKVSSHETKFFHYVFFEGQDPNLTTRKSCALNASSEEVLHDIRRFQTGPSFNWSPVNTTSFLIISSRVFPSISYSWNAVACSSNPAIQKQLTTSIMAQSAGSGGLQFSMEFLHRQSHFPCLPCQQIAWEAAGFLYLSSSPMASCPGRVSPVQSSQF